MSTTSIFKKNRMTTARIIMLLLAGLGFVVDALITQKHTLRPCLLPFGLWLCALLIYGRIHRLSTHEKTED